ncbi:MAG: hypothetical protein ACK5UQ_24065 [Planctomycetota bacterium]
MFAIPLVAQKQVFSTYDWTQSVGEVQFAEVWADVKTPGGFPEFLATQDSRRTYAVGTIEVRDARPNTLFSQSPAIPHDGFGFLLGANQKRQVVIVQSSRTGDNGIQWQTYLYGSSTLAIGEDPRAMNARAISVWEATDPEDARIAVCGETFDEIVPESQAPTGWPQANASHPSGFISVLDGFGNLLWSFHFFAGTNPNLDCAVTDLSIRVDAEGNEIVTYCGISTHGLAISGTTSLNPILPFAAPAPGVSDGSTNQGTGQWDAFVGRLVRSGGTTTRQFHSIVGGPGTDGAFGLAEVEPDLFAVTGFTETTAASGAAFFPFLGGFSGPYRAAFLTVFDARSLATGLKVFSSDRIAANTDGTTTFPRDITVGTSQITQSQAIHKLYVGGSTNDASAPAAAGFGYIRGSLQGVSDGFVAVMGILDPTVTAASLTPIAFSFWGGEGADGITGINNWNEFPDQLATVGFTGTNIGVTSWLHNESFGFATPPGHGGRPTNSNELLELRNETLGDPAAVDLPAAMGAKNATASTAFDTGGLGQESGGGVSVGNDGRVDIVGMSDGSNYPVLGLGSRSNDASRDAVRTELDMVLQPTASASGVGRTDGTGFQPTPAFPPRNSSGQVIFTGGTTPTCALKPFGRRVGEPAPPLQRMLIEYEGNHVTGSASDASILVTRPSSTIGTAIVQLNLPPTTPFVTISGTDFWLGDPSVQNALFAYIGNPVTFRMPLPPINGTGIFSVQLICLVTGTTFGPNCTADFTASPALFFGI